MRLITPSPSGLLDGNRVTTRRWANIFRHLGHQVRTQNHYDGGDCDLLVALHAVKSYQSIIRFRERFSEAPLIVALTGTDLYGNVLQIKEAQASLQLATRLVVLQREALSELPLRWRQKTRVIYQSAKPVKLNSRPPRTHFQVCVVAHMRVEKDPFRTAVAARQLPVSSRIKVLHVGQPLNQTMESELRAELECNPRYQWLGPQSHTRTRRVVATSHLVVLTSRVEGSSNLLSEALVSSVPVVASRIPGLVGTLGEDYPGYFPFADTDALSFLLSKVETEPDFCQTLQEHGVRLARLVQPWRERESWKFLLGELV